MTSNSALFSTDPIDEMEKRVFLQYLLDMILSSIDGSNYVRWSVVCHRSCRQISSSYQLVLNCAEFLKLKYLQLLLEDPDVKVLFSNKVAVKHFFRSEGGDVGSANEVMYLSNWRLLARLLKLSDDYTLCWARRILHEAPIELEHMLVTFPKSWISELTEEQKSRVETIFCCLYRILSFDLDGQANFTAILSSMKLDLLFRKLLECCERLQTDTTSMQYDENSDDDVGELSSQDDAALHPTQTHLAHHFSRHHSTWIVICRCVLSKMIMAMLSSVRHPIIKASLISTWRELHNNVFMVASWCDINTNYVLSYSNIFISSSQCHSLYENAFFVLDIKSIDLINCWRSIVMVVESILSTEFFNLFYMYNK